MLGANCGQRLLDVACGLGRLLEVAKERGLQPIGIDISKVAVEYCQKKFPDIPTVVGNAEELPFDAQEFDFITCLGSLERMLDRDKVLQELKRVLKDNGTICLLVRNSDSWKWKYVKEPFALVNKQANQDAMSLEQWKNLFEKNGLTVADIYCDQWPLMRSKFLATFGLWRNFENIQTSLLPLKVANEFVFIIKKQ